VSPSKYVLQELPHRRQIFVSKSKKTEQAGLKKKVQMFGSTSYVQIFASEKKTEKAVSNK